MKRLLMVAFHFPPFVGSSGIQRTIGFARHLPQCGWEPVVLSAHPRAYERVSEDQLKDIPSGTTIERAFALDSALPRLLPEPDCRAPSNIRIKSAAPTATDG